MPDRVPPDILEFFACHRLAVHMIAVAEKEPVLKRGRNATRDRLGGLPHCG
jgi:hypothetical protein